VRVGLWFASLSVVCVRSRDGWTERRWPADIRWADVDVIPRVHRSDSSPGRRSRRRTGRSCHHFHRLYGPKCPRLSAKECRQPSVRERHRQHGLGERLKLATILGLRLDPVKVLHHQRSFRRRPVVVKQQKNSSRNYLQTSPIGSYDSPTQFQHWLLCFILAYIRIVFVNHD